MTVWKLENSKETNLWFMEQEGLLFIKCTCVWLVLIASGLKNARKKITTA